MVRIKRRRRSPGKSRVRKHEAEAAGCFEMWGGGGGVIFHSAMRMLLHKFSQMPFALFVGTSKPLCNLQCLVCLMDL